MNEARDVLVHYLDALTDGDVERIRAHFTEDATWRLHGDLPLAGIREGRDEILDFLVSAGALYAPGTQNFTFGEITAEGERAVLEWRVRGVSAHTGLTYDNEYCGVFVVRDGRIAEVREYLDTLHAARALFGPVPDNR
jgi:ketosteroid isomerase-like protein